MARRRASRLEAASGRFDAAERALPDGPPFPASVRAQDLAWLALHPSAPSDDRQQRATAALEATSPIEGGGEAAARHYLLGMLALASGRARELNQARVALAEFRPSAPGIKRFASDLSLELEASVARAAGDPESALEILLRASYWVRTSGWIGLPEGTYLSGRQADTAPAFLRAELLREAGRYAEADLWYRVSADGIWYRTSALLELAEMRERERDTAAAQVLRRRVAALWSDADPGVAGR